APEDREDLVQRLTDEPGAQEPLEPRNEDDVVLENRGEEGEEVRAGRRSIKGRRTESRDEIAPSVLAPLARPQVERAIRHVEQPRVCVELRGQNGHGALRQR